MSTNNVRSRAPTFLIFLLFLLDSLVYYISIAYICRYIIKDGNIIDLIKIQIQLSLQYSIPLSCVLRSKKNQEMFLHSIPLFDSSIVLQHSKD